MASTLVATPDPGDSDPTREIGNANLGLQPWSAFYDASEDVPALAWPASPAVYNKMRNDEQIAALLLAFTLPIMGYRWYIDPNGARDEVVEHVATDFGLPIEGQEPGAAGRLKDRFSHEDYLRHALLKLSFGFMMFEQVYRFDEGDSKLHIRKLAPRMPASITQIQAAPDGGLEYIRQFPSGQTWDVMSGKSPAFVDVSPLQGLQSPIIPVDRLIAHVNDKEGGSWFGRSMLRSLFRSYTLKDRLLRVDALKHERNGMGVPIVEAPPNANAAQMALAAQLTQQYKAGEASGGTLPAGFKLRLVGTEGSLPDTLASIRYYDEQISRRFLAMFTQLGSTATGSRALGNTFVDFFGTAQQSVAKNYADVTNAHAIEDLVDLNYGIDENAPVLRFRPESDRGLATADLVSLITAGAITVDTDLEDYLRAENDLPDKPEGEAPPPGPTKALPPGAPETTKPEPAKDRYSSQVRNAVKPKREPSEVEQQAGIDYEAIHAAFDKALTSLVADWSSQIKPVQVEQLAALISATAANDLTSLANLSATPIGSQLLTTAMQDLASTAAGHALDEIKSQGLDVELPDLSVTNGNLAVRAQAIDMVMANSISQTASQSALEQAGGAISSTDMAVSVADHLNSLKDTYLNDQLGGALMQAQNAARTTVFDAVPSKKIYSSELADSPTCCAECEAVNGTEYSTMDAALGDYPAGGYKDCLGGIRCRGTIVIIGAAESEPSK